MPKICFYLHLHQPHRLRHLNVFDVGSSSESSQGSNQGKSLFADGKQDENRAIFQKVTYKSYLPMLNLLLSLIKKHQGFKCAFSISGVFLEQAQLFAPEVIKLLKKLVKTGRVEILAETYYHSLSSLYSANEFAAQVRQHEQAVERYFGIKPVVFRNTELIYSNQIADMVSQLGYIGMITEAVDRYLGGRPRTQVYSSYSENKLPLLLKHAQLSDDIAFRFSDRNWQWHPLTSSRYLDWVEIYQEHEYVNLFMDFETFGEHQWEDTGIFQFFSAFVDKFLERSWNSFVTPSDVFRNYLEDAASESTSDSAPSSLREKILAAVVGTLDKLKSSHDPLILDLQKVSQLPVYDVPEPISWADVDRDTTAWTENDLQQDTLRIMYGLEEQVKAHPNSEVLEKWRQLQISDHYYYMCTKWSADGDVHAYFSPYDSPFEAYRNFCIALADLQESLI